MNGKRSQAIKSRSTRNQVYGDLYTYQGAADYLKKTKNAIKQLVKNGRLTPVKIGNINYIRIDDLSQFKSYGRTPKSDTLSDQQDILKRQQDISSNCSVYSGKIKSDTLSDQQDIFVQMNVLGSKSISNATNSSSEQKSCFANPSNLKSNAESNTFAEREDILGLSEGQKHYVASDNFQNNQNDARKSLNSKGHGETFCEDSADTYSVKGSLSNITSPENTVNPIVTSFNNKKESTNTSALLYNFKNLPLTVSQVAEKLNISPRFVIKKIHRDEIKADRVGSSWLISTKNLDSYIRAKLVQNELEKDANFEWINSELSSRAHHTNKLISALSSFTVNQKAKDSVKIPISTLLMKGMRYRVSFRLSRYIDIRRLAEASSNYGVDFILPENIDLSLLATHLRRRISRLRNGKYLLYFSRNITKNLTLILLTKIDMDQVDYYQFILDKIEELQITNYLKSLHNSNTDRA